MPFWTVPGSATELGAEHSLGRRFTIVLETAAERSRIITGWRELPTSTTVYIRL